MHLELDEHAHRPLRMLLDLRLPLQLPRVLIMIRYDFRRATDAPDPRALDGDALYRLSSRSLDDLAMTITLPKEN